MKASFAPSSPEAAALFKFQDIPVSKYTGTVDINIPVVNIQGKNSNWPINLRYHSSGIKVREVAGYTGLGWQLNVTGMVSRKVRGLADDRPTGYLHFSNWASSIYFPLAYTNTFTEPFATAADFMVNGFRDGEPDEFYFSFNGYSGKMAFKRGIVDLPGRPDIAVSCNVPMKVEYVLSGSRIAAWVFTAPDGLKYTFDVIERTKTRNDPADLCNVSGIRDEYTSSWFLSRISSVTGFATADIRFTYDDYYIDYEWQTSETITYSSTTSGGCYGPIPNSSPIHSFSRNLMQLHGKKIKQIYFNDTKTYVDFIYQNERLDFNATSNNKSLDAIIVSRNEYGSDRNKTIEKVELKYFYQGNRLMLKSVQRVGNDNDSKLPPYEFGYYNEVLPSWSQGGKSIDHWGYAGGNGVFLPKYEELTVPGWNYYPVVGGSARNPVLETTRAQALQKIKYPTGGTTSLEYELNSYGFIQNESLSNLDIYNFEDASGGVEVEGNPRQAGYVFAERRFFVGNDAIQIKFEANATLAPCFSATGPDGNPIPDAPVFCPDRDFPSASVYRELANGELEHIRTFQSNIIDKTISVDLPNAIPGYYVIKAQAKRHITPYGTGVGSISAYLVWKKRVSKVINKSAGGLRVKSITDYDSIGAIGKVRMFDYTGEYEGRIQSSGVIYKEPKYLYTGYPVSSTSPNGGPGMYIYCRRVTITGVSSIQTEETMGSHIGYRQVTEWEMYKGEPNGRTVTQFTSPFTYPDIINDNKPFGIPLTQSYKTGLVEKEKKYNKEGTLVKEDTYEYAFFEQEILSVKVSKGILECPCPGNAPDINSPCGSLTWATDIDGNGQSDLFSRNIFPVRLGFSQIKKEIHTQDGFTIQKIYEYDPALQLIKKITTKNNDTDADSIVVTYKHPGDEISMNGLTQEEYDAINSLKDIGMKTVVLEELKQRKNMNVLRTRTHFKNFIPENFSQTAVSGVSLQVGNAPLERKYSVEGYNPFGKVVQQRKVNDFPQSFIWDEFTENPTAEVSNANVDDIAFTSFENDLPLNGGWTIGSGGAIIRSTIRLTGNFSYAIENGSIVKSHLRSGKKYIISYWSKNGPYQINGFPAIEGRTNGLGWTYYEHITNTTTTSVTITGSGLIDELRLYPEKAEMVTYTYEPGVGMLSKNSVDNIINFYEYDAFNRLKIMRDQDGHILQLNEYKFQVQERSTSPDWKDWVPSIARCEIGSDRNDNNNYNTGYQIKKQTDINPFSPTYNQVQWIRVAQDLSSCPVTPDWQYVGYECVKDNCGNFTGTYKNMEQDKNPYSLTYHQTRLLSSGGTNIAACPISTPCGEGFVLVNNVCVPGQRVTISSDVTNCRRVEVYYFTAPCGARSVTYTKITRIPNCVEQ